VGLPQTVDGLTISVSAGAAAAGDSWLIQPTRSAAADIGVALTDARSIAAAAPIRTAAGNDNLGSRHHQRRQRDLHHRPAAGGLA
jgi:flagellar hook-associated protein 1 FlgK